jgi:hypothetical protein
MEAAPEKRHYHAAVVQMKWRFMNHCQGNYITGCKLKLGFNVYPALCRRIEFPDYPTELFKSSFGMPFNS